MVERLFPPTKQIDGKKYTLTSCTFICIDTHLQKAFVYEIYVDGEGNVRYTLGADIFYTKQQVVEQHPGSNYLSIL